MVFIVGRFLEDDALAATQGRRLPLHPGFHSAQLLDVGAQHLEAPGSGHETPPSKSSGK
jgi:hypothetical protein